MMDLSTVGNAWALLDTRERRNAWIVLGIIIIGAVAPFTNMCIHSISYRLPRSYFAQAYTFFLNRHSGKMGLRMLAEAPYIVQRFLRPVDELVAASLVRCTLSRMWNAFYIVFPVYKKAREIAGYD